MRRIHLSELPLDRLPGEALAVPFFLDQRPLQGAAAMVDWRMNGRFSRLLVEGAATGAVGERIILPANEKFLARWLLFYGAGPVVGAEKVDAVIYPMAVSCLQAGFNTFGIGLPAFFSCNMTGIVAAIERAHEHCGGVLDCTVAFWPAAEDTAQPDS